LACIGRLQFRPAWPADAGRIAALHADSWRRHYRGAYTDDFLDGDAAADRLAVWSDRLGQPEQPAWTILAENDDALVGFAHTIFSDDATWGARLDNLHVSHEHKRNGVGSRLLALTAETVIQQSGGCGLYLWVLEQNVDAQTFYQACGGRCVERAPVPPPGGVPNRLNGSPVGLRYVWEDPSVLLGR
jgi:GNAT superfamily N-acetyltransferase